MWYQFLWFVKSAYTINSNAKVPISAIFWAHVHLQRSNSQIWNASVKGVHSGFGRELVLKYSVVLLVDFEVVTVEELDSYTLVFMAKLKVVMMK